MPEESRVEKSRRMLREHGWRVINACAGPNQSTLEFWGAIANVLILQVWKDGSVACYFSDGNPTWEEWEKML